MNKLQFKLTVRYQVTKNGKVTKHKATTTAASDSAARVCSTLCDALNYQVRQTGGAITNIVIQCSLDHS